MYILLISLISTFIFSCQPESSSGLNAFKPRSCQEFLIKSKSSGECFVVDSKVSVGKGFDVYNDKCSTKNSRNIWSRDVRNRVVSKSGNICLHSSQTFKTTDGSFNIYARNCNKSVGQEFKFSRSGSSFKINSIESELCVTTSSSIKAKNGKNQVYQSKCDKSNEQKFEIVEACRDSNDIGKEEEPAANPEEPSNDSELESIKPNNSPVQESADSSVGFLQVQEGNKWHYVSCQGRKVVTGSKPKIRWKISGRQIHFGDQKLYCPERDNGRAAIKCECSSSTGENFHTRLRPDGQSRAVFKPSERQYIGPNSGLNACLKILANGEIHSPCNPDRDNTCTRQDTFSNNDNDKKCSLFQLIK